MSYKELFLKHKIVRQLSYVQFIAYFGAWFSNVAIYSMLVELNATAFLIATVTAMHLIPAVILAPFSGSIVDRLPVKKLMMGLLFIEFCMTMMFLTIHTLDDITMLLVFLFIRMGSASIFFTTEMTLLPKLLNGEALIKANEIHSIIWSFTFTAGMAFGGIVVNLYGTPISFIIDGLFFVTALILLKQINFDIITIKPTETIFSSIKSGIQYIKNHKYLLHFMFLHATVGLTAFDTLITLLADYEYKYIISIPLAIGISNAVRAFALMIGPLFITNLVNKNNLYYIFIIQGVSIYIWSLLQYNFYYALFGLFLTGLMTTTIWSYTYAMLQDKIEKQYLGRVLAYNEMIFMAVNISTTFFIGFMASLVGLDIITTILAVAFLFVAYYYKRVFL